MSASSPSDVWAVGQFRPGASSDSRPLAIHWDGSRWTKVATHDPVDGDYLTGVTAVGPDDAWAVGNGNTDDGLIEHWDGARWTVVNGPRSGPLAQVDASGPDDVWAVGRYWDGATYRDLMEHWDGTSWTVVDGADSGVATPGLSDVFDLAPGDAWAVGTYDQCRGGDPAHL